MASQARSSGLAKRSSSRSAEHFLRLGPHKFIVAGKIVPLESDLLRFFPKITEIANVNTSEAIVIRLTRLTETSLIVHWFTETHGLVKTMAKGARRARSPFSGQIDLFFGGEVAFIHAKHGELHTLCEVAVRHWREGLRKNYTSTLLAAYCCQLLETAVEPEHPEPELHDLLKRALDHLDHTPPSQRALLHFEAELARLLGVSHGQQPAHLSLRNALGTLPPSRAELVERLSPAGHFS
jgi:DNA repair protein RecO (recombination protein O)